MNLKAFFTLICLLTLSACGHLTGKSKRSPIPDVSASSTEASNTAPQYPTNNDKVTPQTVDSETVANTQQTDTLMRIQQGFQLAEFNSKHVADYEHWAATHPTYLNNLFERSKPFLFYIVNEIEKRGLPMELALLPAIESAYKPNAVSRSKAAGLWQFIPATGKGFGLTQDWWYDGRRDLISSTNAALDYLTQLNKMFDGDWFLTLAAYNAGPGTVQRAIKYNKRKGRKTDYKSLKLRSETVRYVPKLIALKNILLRETQYKLDLPVVSNEPQFEILTFKRQIDLHRFAEKANINHNELMHLNAGFRRWATPPNGPHRLLIPSQHIDAAKDAQVALKTSPEIDYRNHTIATGDSLSGISQRYGVSISALKSTNKLSSNAIRAGRNLLIPVKGAEQYTSPQSDSASNNNKPTKKIVHRVQQGDTLWSIAKHYKVKLQQLVAWNKISSDHILQLNQPLLLFTY